MKLHDISFQNARVLCLGDLLLDRFVYGSVHRISPEAPIPVLKTNREFWALGGAGNVVRNLASLGCHSTYIGIAGRDDAGQKVASLLNELPDVQSHLTFEGRTPVKARFISNAQQLLRVDDEVISTPSPLTLEMLKSTLKELISSVKVVILSDYGKGSLTPDLCQFTIQTARKFNIPVIVDPKGQDYTRYQGATLLTPNEKELREITPFAIDSEADIARAITELQSQFQVDAVLVTRGAKGMTLLPTADVESLIHIPAQAREIFDVSGAGDTVIATLATAISTNHSLLESAQLANLAGGVVVGKVGTAVVTPDELKTALIDSEPSIPSKIRTLDDAKGQAQIWRRQGLTVGFTNGCFDLLHLGHLHSLQESKSTCDRLVIGLNSDASIKRLKGEERPIQSEMVRAHVLAALEYVDAVIIFDEDTPLNLIESLLPDVLCKGADYTVETVVGADVVQLNGGKVHLIDLKPGYSTTATVEKLRKIA